MDNPVVRQNYLKLLVVWWTLLSSQVLFFVIVIFNQPGLFPPDFSQSPVREGNEMVLIAVLLLLALMNIGFSVLIKVSGIRKALDERNVGSLQTALVVGCALCETTSVFGMVLALGFSYPYFFVWFVLGFFGILYHFPQKRNVRLATLKA